MNIHETPAVYTYDWEIGGSDITEFVKTGHIAQAGTGASFYYQGRYYPVYTTFIGNTPAELAFQIRDKEETLIFAPDMTGDHGDLDPMVVDVVDISGFKDYVKLIEVPGIGTLLEIVPMIPQPDGRVRLLKRARIEILSTSQKSLQKSDLVKDRTKLSKTSSLRAELPGEFLDLYISEPGVFQVSGQDLADRGIDLRTVHPDNIKLTWWGEELPCRVTSIYEMGRETFQYENVVQFSIPRLKNPYGDYLYNPFTHYDVVRMSWGSGNGKRYVQENSEITGNATFLPQDNRTFRSTVHIEKNVLYQPLARLHEQELSHKYEHMFYSPSIRIGRSVSFDFNLWDPVPDSPYNVNFTLRMQGLTYSVDDEMDHQIYVTVNDQYLLEDEWDGQVPNISSNTDMQYDHDNLIHGKNTIDISVKGFEDNPYLDDQVLFDWLEVSYDRFMIAHENRLEFSPQHGPG
ncbi:MAG: hypothetical protein JXR21_06285, partial [Candidatus Marinimicrobia bacterium]|nr:hypothetical protein [Candidatus Neomarinimicrobiota bacterium]